MTDESDVLYVQKVLEGDVDAFGALIEKYQQPVYRLAFRMLHNHDDAEDVSQNVFLKAFERIASFNTKYRFFSWIYRIAVNECINFRKTKRSTVNVHDTPISNGKTPETEAVKNERISMLNNALLMLAPDYRMLIVLKHLEGFSYAEIADVTDTAEKKVKSRLYSAREMLRTMMGFNNEQ